MFLSFFEEGVNQDIPRLLAHDVKRHDVPSSLGLEVDLSRLEAFVVSGQLLARLWLLDDLHFLGVLVEDNRRRLDKFEVQ